MSFKKPINPQKQFLGWQHSQNSRFFQVPIKKKPVFKESQDLNENSRNPGLRGGVGILLLGLMLTKGKLTNFFHACISNELWKFSELLKFGEYNSIDLKAFRVYRNLLCITGVFTTLCFTFLLNYEMFISIILELQQINNITCLENELNMDYSIFAFMDQTCGTLLQKCKIILFIG